MSEGKIGELLKLAKSFSLVPLDKEQEEKQEMVINELGMELASRNVHSVKVLLEILEKEGPIEFLRVAERFLETKMVGLLIYWGYESCGNDLREFLDKVKRGDEKMVEEVNSKAELHECFAENQKNVGRVLLKKTEKKGERKKLKISHSHLYTVALLIIIVHFLYSILK